MRRRSHHSAFESQLSPPDPVLIIGERKSVPFAERDEIELEVISQNRFKRSPIWLLWQHGLSHFLLWWPFFQLLCGPRGPSWGARPWGERWMTVELAHSPWETLVCLLYLVWTQLATAAQASEHPAGPPRAGRVRTGSSRSGAGPRSWLWPGHPDAASSPLSASVYVTSKAGGGPPGRGRVKHVQRLARGSLRGCLLGGQNRGVLPVTPTAPRGGLSAQVGVTS